MTETKKKKDDLRNKWLYRPVNAGYTECRDVLSKVSSVSQYRWRRYGERAHTSPLKPLTNKPSLPGQDLLFSPPPGLTSAPAPTSAAVSAPESSTSLLLKNVGSVKAEDVNARLT